jgi:hypothetical protein
MTISQLPPRSWTIGEAYVGPKRSRRRSSRPIFDPDRTSTCLAEVTPPQKGMAGARNNETRATGLREALRPPQASEGLTSPA